MLFLPLRAQIDNRNSFGVYDSLKPVVLVGALKGSFLASFMLGWGVTIGAGLASYPLDTIRLVSWSSTPTSFISR